MRHSRTTQRVLSIVRALLAIKKKETVCGPHPHTHLLACGWHWKVENTAYAPNVLKNRWAPPCMHVLLLA
jgi:hypothetical protein